MLFYMSTYWTHTFSLLVRKGVKITSLIQKVTIQTVQMATVLFSHSFGFPFDKFVNNRIPCGALVSI